MRLFTFFCVLLSFAPAVTAQNVGSPARPSATQAQSGFKVDVPKPGTTETVIEEEIVTKLKPFWSKASVKVNSSFRGLDVVDDSTVWVCGSKGKVARTVDGGKTWKICTVPGGDKIDLRDIHAIDGGVALVMTSGQPARIYQTTDSGTTWDVNFEYGNKNVYFNSMSFWDDSNGILMSDPIDGRMLLLTTSDGGVSWQQLKPKYRPRLLKGERGFAASGTNMRIAPGGRLFVGLGSGLEGQQEPSSRVLFSNNRGGDWAVASLPMVRSRTQGIFSICFATKKNGVAIGGNYKDPESRNSLFAVTDDGGETWTAPANGKSPSGFRSCVTAWHKGQELTYVAVGPTGTDLSTDLGSSWRKVSNQGYNVVEFSPSGNTGWAAGSQGRIARYVGR